MTLENEISDLIADYWLNKNQYCGLSSYHLYEILKEKEQITEDDIKKTLKKMEGESLISTREFQSGDRVHYVWKNNQFQQIIDPGPHLDLWAHPKQKLLEKYDDSKVEDVGIYKKQLRLGGSQIEHRYFNRQVLDRYRDDPRYVFEEGDSSGFICTRDEYFLDESISDEDKFLIQSFGYAYDSKGEQVIAVILSYLGALSLRHQNHWHSYEITDSCKLDADYVETSFEAKPTERISIYRAFLQELEEINKICALLSEHPLFNETFSDKKPPQFGRLTRPTRRELNEFIHLLDRMISDNINKDFFREKVDLTEEEIAKDGKLRVIDKGTIRLLEEYLQKYWGFPDPKPKNVMIETFKQIRKERQEPAHRIINNEYDEDIFREQKELMIKAYRAIRTLRLILQNHPKAREYMVPRRLNHGRII